jgi:hypothetical protein
MSSSQKNKLVARYIALAPPFVGAPKAAQGPFGFDSDYSFGLWLTEIGLTPSMFKETLARFPGVYNLMLKNTFNSQANAAWMKEFNKRFDYESGKGSRPTTGTMAIFPDKNTVCNSGFKSRDEKCTTGLFPMKFIGKVNGEYITNQSLQSLFKKYSYEPRTGDLFKAAQDSRFNDFPNPGVQVNIIYSSVIPTLYNFEYSKDPKTMTRSNKHYEPEVKKNYLGDGSVLVSSAITPGIKWAYEFDKRQSGAKPVNFIELCGDYNRRTSIFNSGSSVTKNAYFGINCTCKGGKYIKSDGKKCGEHAALVEDALLIEFVFNSVKDGQTGRPSGKFSSMSSTTLKSYEDNCKMYKGL